MADVPTIEDGTVVDLDALVTIAAQRGSGLQTQRAGVGVRVTARAARWLSRKVCRPPVVSVVDMVAVHVRRRAVRTDFVADASGSEGTVCLAWCSSNRSRDLTLVIAYGDEPGTQVPCLDASPDDRWGRP